MTSVGVSELQYQQNVARNLGGKKFTRVFYGRDPSVWVEHPSLLHILDREHAGEALFISEYF
jgi:hypothetical protein